MANNTSLVPSEIAQWPSLTRPRPMALAGLSPVNGAMRQVAAKP